MAEGVYKVPVCLFQKKRIVDKLKLLKVHKFINTKKDILNFKKKNKLLNEEDTFKIEDIELQINKEFENQGYEKLVKVLGS